MLVRAGRLASGRIDELREPPSVMVRAHERMRFIYEASGEASFIE